MKLSNNLNLLIGAIALLGCGQHFLITSVKGTKYSNVVNLGLSSIDNRGHSTSMEIDYYADTGKALTPSGGVLFNILDVMTTEEYNAKIKAKSDIEKLDQELRNQLEVENYATIGMMVMGLISAPPKPEVQKQKPRVIQTVPYGKVEIEFTIPVRRIASPQASKQAISEYKKLIKDTLGIDTDQYNFKGMYDDDYRSAAVIRCSKAQFADFIIARSNSPYLQNIVRELNAKVV